MSNLKLGPLPKLGIVRMTVPMPEPLKEELDLYAAEGAALPPDRVRSSGIDAAPDCRSTATTPR